MKYFLPPRVHPTLHPLGSTSPSCWGAGYRGEGGSRAGGRGECRGGLASRYMGGPGDCGYGGPCGAGSLEGGREIFCRTPS